MADQSIAMALVRLVVAVVVVIGLLLLIAKLTRRVGIRADGSAGPAIRMISRQPLGRNASIAVVRAGDRTLVLGVTDHSVTLLSDQNSAEFPDQDLNPKPRRDPNAGGGGSVNGPEAPVGFLAKLRERTIRKT